MMEQKRVFTRSTTYEDIPQLKTLWKTVFGDDDADIGHFFDTYFSPDRTVVVDGGFEDGGSRPVSAAYILPVGELVLPGGRLPAAMLYAIATQQEYRGRGYGEAVTREAFAQAVRLGYPAVVLKPANAGLFEFYEKRTDFRAFFDVHEADYPAEDLPAGGRRISLTPVSPAEYRRIRQGLLEGCAYIDFDERALSYQHYLCEKAGGGLYALRHGGHAGCAVIEPEGSAVHIRELLLSPGSRVIDAVSGAARLVTADRYLVRTLPISGEKQNRCFAMLATAEGCPNVSYVYSAKWYGPAFD